MKILLTMCYYIGRFVRVDVDTEYQNHREWSQLVPSRDVLGQEEWGIP